MARMAVIAGNWKMNTSPSEGVELAKNLKNRLKGVQEVEIIVAPPFTHLHAVGEAIKGSNLKLASQNVYFEESGAFTGEVSPGMIKELGCDYVIIGHSERRQYFGETNESVNAKTKAVLHHGVRPIVCVGETLEEREAGQALAVIGGQLEGGLKGLSASDSQEIVIAYEPVWAIGTGKTATKEEAEEVHAFIRQEIAKVFGEEGASSIRILYGGSVKPENIDDLMAEPNIDGALVGGASLKNDSFEKIVKFKRG